MSIENIIKNTPISHKIEKLKENEKKGVFVNFHDEYIDVESFSFEKKNYFRKHMIF